MLYHHALHGIAGVKTNGVDKNYEKEHCKKADLCKPCVHDGSDYSADRIIFLYHVSGGKNPGDSKGGKLRRSGARHDAAHGQAGKLTKSAG